jgi:excisionase family DNA binding protein
VQAPTDPARVDQEYMTAAQVAKMTGLSAKTLERMRAQRRGPPYYKIGRAVRYLRAEVRAWMEAQRVVVGASTRCANE